MACPGAFCAPWVRRGNPQFNYLWGGLETHHSKALLFSLDRMTYNIGASEVENPAPFYPQGIDAGEPVRPDAELSA